MATIFDKLEPVIQRYHEISNSYAEAIFKRERENDIVAENNSKDKSEVKEIAVQILEQKQKPFTTVIPRSSSHRTGRWCQKERQVVGLSVIESGEPKSGWSPEDQKRR